ncbi:MAG TPA: bifunctional 5,10-methylenetetrahydrofolate dehydrogenase/5,10-methenyltetrahydrofolate cyclohydrolase [Acetobacteraceae bacterium]|jgi:methylenetetrahydrofolate dehydrogenase (NADP+)/methenyltetrahydrofolate cyclohydrolase
MTARLIDGIAIAAAMRNRLAAQVAGLGYRPRLVVILVGDDAASAVYVRAKDRAATAAGIVPQTVRLPADTPQPALLAEIARLNADPDTDGILVQLPLPPQIDEAAVQEAVDPAKDVDGFHPLNVGRLAAGRAFLVPCTPLGVMQLLQETGVALDGTPVLMLGRSLVVGRPLVALLLAANATVTVAHSHTRDLAKECRRAEVVIAAVGQPELVRGDWIRPGATVIDVGVNRRADGKLVGDVVFDECAAVAGAITPVPGGVGPMTIACLLSNTVVAATRRRDVGSPSP